MVNPDVDGYTKTLNHVKILRIKFYGRCVPLDSITYLSTLVHERLGVKQVVLNALIKLTFILYF